MTVMNCTARGLLHRNTAKSVCHFADSVLIRPLSGTSSFSNDTVRFTAVSAHACYNGNFGI